MKLIGCIPDGRPDGTNPDVERAHDQNLRHYSVHVLAVPLGSNGSADRVVMRRRGATEARYPGKLTSTTGAHLTTGLSPQQVIDEATGRTGIKLGALSYVGSFQVDDGVENEICTLWTAEVDTSWADAEFVEAGVHEVGPSTTTPHLAECLKLWKERA